MYAEGLPAPASAPAPVVVPRVTSRVRRPAVAAGLSLAVLLVAAYVAICGYMALTLTRRDNQAFTRFPEQLGLAYETVTFASQVDRIPLEGWLLPAAPGTPSRRPVIFVHGKSGNRQHMAAGSALEIARHLVHAGHPVLLFDLRGAGRSGGTRFTLGAQEVRDVGGAVDFLDRRGLAPQGVNLLGYSMGGATAVLYAPGDRRVRTVAEDSGYGTLGDILDDQVPKASKLPRFFTPGTVLMAWPLMGVNAYGIRPVERVPALAAQGTPLLVAHCEGDTTVPVRHGRSLAAAYGPGVATLLSECVNHTGAFAYNPAQYMDRLMAFFAAAE